MSEKGPVEIAENIWQIRIPLPIKSLGSVYAYYFQDKGENLLLDAGWPSESSYDSLEASLATIGVKASEIKTLVVSHLHPDHFGLAQQIKDQNPNGRLIMHDADAAHIVDSYEQYNRLINELHLWLELNGTSKNELDAMLDASTEMLRFFRPPKPTILVKGGEIIKVGEKWRFEVIHSPGHTEGTICLYDVGGSKTLFSGDHILPTITPNVSLGPLYMGNPLGDYLESLEKVENLDVLCVLPSHEYVFSDLGKRVLEIRAHHHARLDECLSIFASSVEQSGGNELTAFEVASRLHWYSGSWASLGPWERRAALMETLAHLEYLKRARRIVEIESLKDGKPRIQFALFSNSC